MTALICMIIVAVIGLGVATYLMVAGVQMILGGIGFGAKEAVLVGIICLLAGGLVGYAAMQVAPINVELKVLQ